MSALIVRFRSFGVVVLVLLLFGGIAIPRAMALESDAKAAILIDAMTGAVLFEKNADEPYPPSSMSKMMTVYLVFQRLKDGRLSLDDTLSVSEAAWRKGGSKMFVEVGKDVAIKDLVRGIIVQSGNDASIVVAEGLAGSESAFALEMNAEGQKMGLANSVFKNATGWPAEGQHMSVRDIATVALWTIKDFPEYYGIYSEKEFTYGGIRQGNRNPLLYGTEGADGLKTGHTEAIGYGLASSVIRNGRRLVLVVNGLPSKRARAGESRRILEWGFREFNNYELFKAGEEVDKAHVWLGRENTVPLVVEKDIVLTLPRKSRKDMKISVAYSDPVPAPVTKGTQVAMLKIQLPGEDMREVPLVAGKNVEQLGFFGKMGAAMRYLLWGASH